MKVLLDTHAFIWWDSDPAKLSAQARGLCEDRANVVFLSVASVWEMQIKLQLGKLELRRPLAELIANQRQTNDLNHDNFHRARLRAAKPSLAPQGSL